LKEKNYVLSAGLNTAQCFKLKAKVIAVKNPARLGFILGKQ
jgi:hypothetical protein